MKKIITALLLSTTLTGCIGQRVEIPPASVGMIYGPNGYEGDLIPPSRFRLPFCFLECDKLVVIEAGDIGMKEAIDVLMAKDNLILGVDVRFTLAMSKDKDKILTVFDRAVPIRLESGNYGTTISTIYETYGKAVVRNVVRSVLSKYTIHEIAANQESVSETLKQAVAEALKKTPLEIKQFGLAGIHYPAAVKEGMEANQRRRIDIERAEADAQVEIREAQTKLEVTRAEREADLLAARTIAEQNKILADGVTPEVIRYLELEVLKKMAENENTVFFPVEMMGSTGLHHKIFNKE